MAQFYSAKRRVTTRQIITVTVTELDGFGQGVAHHNGKALFIDGALPDERVEVELTEEKRSFARGKAKRILTTSPDRVVPQCRHFTRCGGCQQQHVSPALQQRSKAAALSRLMTRETGQAVTVDTLISGSPYGYRRRARLGLSYQPRQQTLQMGFRRADQTSWFPLPNARFCALSLRH